MRPVNLKSYDDAKALFSTCRFASKGKPLPGRWRLFKEDDDYAIKMERWGSYDPLPICTISPDEIVTFTISEKDLIQYSNSLVMILWKILPIGCERKRSGVYIMGPVRINMYHYGYLDKGSSYEYFQGLQVRLTDLQFLNPKPNFTDQVVPDVKKAWLKDIKRFKKGLKVRAKVGALNGVIEEVRQLSGNWKTTTGKSFWEFQESRAQVDTPESIELVLECMREDKFPPELLTSLVFWGYCNHGPYRRNDFNQQHLLKFVDRMFTNHSLTYRKAYGVFGDEYKNKGEID